MREPLTAMTKKFDPTIVQVDRQLRGMGCERYEIGVRSSNGMLIKRWTARDVMLAVKWLRYENSQGANIYVRPARDENAALILLDDLKRDVVERLKCDGFEPAVLVETSIGNFQAWIRLAAREQKLDAAIRTRVARELASRYCADPNSADAVHFGRLAGFTNRKPVYASGGVFPWVVLHSYCGKVAHSAGKIIATCREKADDLVLSFKVESFETWDEQQIDELSAWYADALKTAIADVADHSRADWIVALDMLKSGCPAAVVAYVMFIHSERKHDAVDYVSRTVAKAVTFIASGKKYSDVADVLLEYSRSVMLEIKSNLLAKVRR